ncbi:MAG: hypothetical protein HC818_04615 [Synechococcaceae cyanobacterium RM1_1_27]|nr:hypothetical protein [Synechococcaceae cyanobacterium RM1_1_27]
MAQPRQDVGGIDAHHRDPVANLGGDRRLKAHSAKLHPARIIPSHHPPPQNGIGKPASVESKGSNRLPRIAIKKTCIDSCHRPLLSRHLL